MLSADVAKIQAVSVKEPTQFAELLSCGDLLLTRIKRIDIFKENALRPASVHVSVSRAKRPKAYTCTEEKKK